MTQFLEGPTPPPPPTPNYDIYDISVYVKAFAIFSQTNKITKYLKNLGNAFYYVKQ